jgi:hypothetical protein
MNKAPTGPYLAKVGQVANDKCWWRGSGENLCKHWVIMWRQIGGTQTVRNTSMVQLFGDERCTAANFWSSWRLRRWA